MSPRSEAFTRSRRSRKVKLTLLMLLSGSEWSTLRNANGSVPFERPSVGVFSAIGRSLAVTFSVKLAFRDGVTSTVENETFRLGSGDVETFTATDSFAEAFATVTLTLGASAERTGRPRSVAFSG